MLSAQEVDPDCLERMRKGVFVVNSDPEIEVIRTSKEYVEVYNHGDSKLFHQITWENDSTYVLTMKRAVNAVGCLQVGQTVRTTIVGCSGDLYMTLSESEFCGDSEEVFRKTL